MHRRNGLCLFFLWAKQHPQFRHVWYSPIAMSTYPNTPKTRNTYTHTFPASSGPHQSHARRPCRGAAAKSEATASPPRASVGSDGRSCVEPRRSLGCCRPGLIGVFDMCFFQWNYHEQYLFLYQLCVSICFEVISTHGIHVDLFFLSMEIRKINNMILAGSGECLRSCLNKNYIVH